LLKIDLCKLTGQDFTNSSPAATFTDLASQQMPAGTGPEFAQQGK